MLYVIAISKYVTECHRNLLHVHCKCQVPAENNDTTYTRYIQCFLEAKLKSIEHTMTYYEHHCKYNKTQLIHWFQYIAAQVSSIGSQSQKSCTSLRKPMISCTNPSNKQHFLRDTHDFVDNFINNAIVPWGNRWFHIQTHKNKHCFLKGTSDVIDNVIGKQAFP